MNGWSAWTASGTDPRDVGCAEAMDLLHVYAELAAAGDPAAERYPGIAAHLRACGPCGEDFDGLLAALRPTADSDGGRGPGAARQSPCLRSAATHPQFSGVALAVRVEQPGLVRGGQHLGDP